MLLLFTYKLSHVPLFPGHKVSNDDGLSMVSAVRTFTLLRKVPYPTCSPWIFCPGEVRATIRHSSQFLREPLVACRLGYRCGDCSGRRECPLWLCLVSQVALVKVKRKLKEGAWLGKKKENTVKRFITLLETVQLGKLSLGDKTVLRVQKKNPLRKILQRIFDLSPFDLARDTEISRV